MHNVGNKAKRGISKWVFHENKARQIFRITNISYPLIRSCKCSYQGVRNVRFSKNWCALFSWNTRFEILPFDLLPTIMGHRSWFWRRDFAVMILMVPHTRYITDHNMQWPQEGVTFRSSHPEVTRYWDQRYIFRAAPSTSWVHSWTCDFTKIYNNKTLVFYYT